MKKLFTTKWLARNPMKENAPTPTVGKCKKKKLQRIRELPAPELEDILLGYRRA